MALVKEKQYVKKDSAPSWTAIPRNVNTYSGLSPKSVHDGAQWVFTMKR